MEVVIQLPQAIELGSIQIDEQTRRIRLTPLFSAQRATATLGHIEVVGVNGASRRCALLLSGNTGAVKARELTPTAAAFDDLTSDAVSTLVDDNEDD